MYEMKPIGIKISCCLIPPRHLPDFRQGRKTEVASQGRGKSTVKLLKLM